ncbi:MAG: type II secretion system F family protein [Candidatus Pacebacteria bacterium]|nr:type II secretion system F family protein [Candidatus Paceibacterota bacterium]
MTEFHYKAKNKEGEVYKGTISALDKFALYTRIREEGGEVLEVVEAGSRRFSMEWFNEVFGAVREHEKIVVTRNLGAMIDAGLSLSRSLAVLERQTRNPKLKIVLSSLNRNIKAGGSFHGALGEFPKVFSPLFVSMVRAGEESGKLSYALSLIGRQLERSYTLKRKIRGALMYPSIIIIAMIIIGVLMLIYVVPTLTQTFNELGAELPKSTQAVIGVSDFLTHNTLLALLIPLALGGLFYLGLRQPQGRRAWEFTYLHIPIVGPLVKEVYAARTARTFASLLSSGVEIVTAISITSDVMQNSYYREVLKRAEHDVQKGASLSGAFAENEHLYPILVGEMISVGEETGKLPDMLLRVAEFFEEEVEQKTKDMSTIIEPFLMIVIGTFVGFFALSMISPIYSLSESI